MLLKQGKHPYLDASMRRDEIIKAMQEDILFLEDDLDDEPSSLFRKMTEMDSKERYTAEECLKHPWI